MGHSWYPLHMSGLRSSGERNRWHMRVHIVPTYQCDLDCWYCYAAPFRSRFPTDLALDQYTAILTDLLPRGLTSVSFLGGEPTLWPHLSEAMIYAQRLGLKRLLYTNGYLARCTPDIVTMNITPWKRGIIERVVESLEWYHSRDISIVFRLNMAKGDSDAHLPDIVELAKTFDAQLSMTALESNPRDLSYGEQIFRWCVHFIDASVRVHVSRPLPLCMLTQFQREFLQSGCGLRGVCDFENAVPVINPDGKTVFPCNSLPIDLPLDYISKRQSYSIQWKHVACSVIKLMPEPCRECHLFLENQCQCGCLGTRWQSETKLAPL